MYIEESDLYIFLKVSTISYSSWFPPSDLFRTRLLFSCLRLYMNFPTTSGTLAQAQLQEARPRALEASLAQTHSRELGVFVSEVPNHGAPIVKNDLPVAKSWAHFVAGGSETPLLRANRADDM